MIFAVLALAGGVLLGAAATWAQPKAAAPPPVEVVVAEVRRQHLSDTVEALGTTRANESVVLTSRVAETVRSLHFDDGQRVQAGQVLVELISQEEKAAVEEAVARLREAQSQHQRVKDLADRDQAARAQLDERWREVETARARLLALQARLADHQVVAPFDGVLGLRQVSVGAFVQPGTVITTLNDLGTIKLDFSVPATYLATLRPGLAIQARASAPRGRLFAGQVSYVNTEVDPVTRSVLVRALLPNPDGLLRPGMLMTVTLYKDERDALVVPEAALVSRGREATVLAVSAGEPARVERRPVRIGTRSPGIVEVLEGLAEGERVITHGTLRVRPGQAVVVRAVERPGEGLDELLREPRAAAGGG